MFTSKIAAHVKLTAIASLAVGFLTGCPSMPMMTTAKTIGDAKNELTIAPGVVGFSASAFGGTGTLTLPDVGLGYRRGIGDSFDLGVTVGGFGHLQLDGKVNFLGNAKGDKFALAIDPTVGGVFIGAGNVGAGYVDFAVPVLMDLAVNDSVRFTIGPRYRGYLLFAGASGVGSESHLSHLIGTGLGGEFVVGDTVALQPWGTVDYLLNPVATEGKSTSAILFTGGLAIKLRF